MNTIRFGRSERERDELLSRVAALPGSVEPPKDLWPGIRARLDRQEPAARTPARGLPWRWSLAASVAVASVSVLFTWMAMRTPGNGPAQPASQQAPYTGALETVSYGNYARLGQDYVDTRARMQALFNARLAELPDDTRVRVGNDLAAIRKAASDIDAALAQDPSSRLLNNLLLGTYQDEMRLYTRVAAPLAADSGRT